MVIFGYGNPSRGDDALGPELLRLIGEQKLKWPAWNQLELITDYQLSIEHAVDLENQDLALFIDASVSCPAPFRFARLRAERDTSYTSHAMSPSAVLQVYNQVNGCSPPSSFLLSIRGVNFDLGAALSKDAEEHLAAAWKKPYMDGNKMLKVTPSKSISIISGKSSEPSRFVLYEAWDMSSNTAPDL